MSDLPRRKLEVAEKFLASTPLEVSPLSRGQPSFDNDLGQRVQLFSNRSKSTRRRRLQTWGRVKQIEVCYKEKAPETG